MSDVQIALDVNFLRNMTDKINALDAKLDRSSGSKTSYKNTIERELTAKYREEFSENIGRIVDWAQSLGEEQRAGFYFLLNSSFDDSFGKEVDGLLESRAEQRAKEAVPLPAEEEEKIRNERKMLNDQFKAAYNLMDQWGADLKTVEKPKIRRGAPAGDRGPRQLSRFDYRINGMPLASEKNGLGPVASAIFGIKVTELKAKIKEASEGKLDPSDADALPDEWEVVIPHPQTGDNIKLSASRMEEFRGSDEEENDGETVVSDETPQAEETPEPQAVETETTTTTTTETSTPQEAPKNPWE